MPQKNTTLSTRSKNIVPAFLYKGRFIVAGIFALLMLFSASSCKKLRAAAGDRSALEALFEENILNRNFVVHLATDSGRDITSEFHGYNFILTKTTSYYNGAMTGTKDGVKYTGTWTCNDDFGKLSISLTSPSIPAAFIFINRDWKFTKKAFPIMELAPWGTTDPKVLHMERL
ncbi:MAG: hypothetical protein ABIQ31_08120 [Ferruginibacter sp.]